MISEPLKEKLWYMGYCSNDDGDIEVEDDIGQQIFRVIHEESGKVVLFGGMAQEAVTVRLKEMEWSRDREMGAYYSGFRPRTMNGNWPRMSPTAYKRDKV